MTKVCADLFEGIEHTVIGDAREKVEDLAYRSDCVQPGDLFFCIVGAETDGHSFAQDAIDRGARTLVLERVPHLADSTNVTEVVVGNSRKAMAVASAAFYDNPSRAFSLVGITGTNGKTTVARLVEYVVASQGKRCGVITSLGAKINGVHEDLARTTPESPDLQHLFARMRDARCDVVAAEMSSHALDMLRPWGSAFAVTAFTNLSPEHLDYHHTPTAYFEAKALLFSRDYPARRVINIDSQWGCELLRRCSAAEDSVITTGFTPSAQIHPVSIEPGENCVSAVLEVRGAHYNVTYPATQAYCIENLMTAFGIALQLGIPADTIAAALANVPPEFEKRGSSCA